MRLIPRFVGAATAATLAIASGATSAEAEAPPPSVDAQEAIAAVDLAIDELGVVELSRSPRSTAIVPEALQDGVTLATGQTVTTRVDDLSSRELVDGVAVFTGDSSDVVVDVGPGHTRFVVSIKDPEAPRDYRFDVALKPGESLQLANGPRGRVLIVDALGETVSSFDPPWALDASGNEVPTHYEIDEDTIVQVVEHVGFEYPVAADPSHNCGWVTCTIYFSKSETKTLSQAGWGAATITGLCTAAGGPIAGAACLASVGGLVLLASNAVNSGRCVKIKYTPTPPTPVNWPGYHDGSRCR